MSYTIVPYQSVDTQSDVSYGAAFQFNTPQTFVLTTTLQQEAVAQFKNMLLTFPGERYMNPGFGCDLKSLIFEPNNSTIALDIIESITSATTTWCPDINIETIDVRTAADDPTLMHTVNIRITFGIGNSNTGQQIIINAEESGNILIS